MGNTEKERKCVDEAAMRRVLEAEADSAAGLILCLAWEAGLSVEEMRRLCWKDISPSCDALWVAQRRVALNEETARRLRAWKARYAAEATDAVLRTEVRNSPMSGAAAYRLARRALDREETLQSVTLKMLRQDHGCRLLRAMPAGGAEEVEFALWTAVQAEGASAEGLAIWMMWQLGLHLQEVVGLTWDRVDMEGNMLHLPQREIAMGVTLERLLRQAQRERRLTDTFPHVLLTPKSRRPYDAARLSRRIAAVLRRFDVALHPGDLPRLHAAAQAERQLLSRVKRSSGISRQTAAKWLGLSPDAAYRRLSKLTEQGRLERIGGKYYPAGTTVPAAEMEAAVCAYLEQEQGACCRQVAEKLGIELRQCRHILRRMELDGRLIKRDRQYHTRTAN